SLHAPFARTLLPPTHLYVSLSFLFSLHPRYPHSFPTRRSSDLLRIPAFVVGPAPSRDPATTAGVRELSGAFEDVCARRLIPYVEDRKSTRLNSRHVSISYAVFCLKKKTSARPDSHPALCIDQST